MYIVQLYIGAPALPNHELWQQSLQSCASAERAPGVFGFAIIWCDVPLLQNITNRKVFVPLILLKGTWGPHNSDQPILHPCCCEEDRRRES